MAFRMGLRYIMAHKTIAITASIVMTLYLSFSAVFAATYPENNLCCYASAKNLYTQPCCDEDESFSDCCYCAIPPPNETLLFLGLLDRESYRNNTCDLQKIIPDSLILTELYGIVCEERFTPKDVIYPVFRPPKV
jgi:hypothetical protein